MKLEEIISNPQSFIYMERYVNAGSRTYSSFSSFNGVAPRYQPMSDAPYFELPFVIVPREKVGCYFDDPAPALRDFYIRGNSVLFPVHPEVFYSNDEDPLLRELPHYPRAASLRVAPTSSTRTVMVLDGQGVPVHFLKLHCPRRISRFTREMSHETVYTETAISQDLQNIASYAPPPPRNNWIGVWE